VSGLGDCRCSLAKVSLVFPSPHLRKYFGNTMGILVYLVALGCPLARDRGNTIESPSRSREILAEIIRVAFWTCQSSGTGYRCQRVLRVRANERRSQPGTRTCSSQNGAEACKPAGVHLGRPWISQRSAFG